MWWKMPSWRLRRLEVNGSGGEVNDRVGWFGGKRLPAVDLAHGDLSGREQRPTQHSCGLRRRQDGLALDAALELLVQPFDGIGGARRAPLAGWQAGEGEQPVARFLQTVGDRPALQPPLAQQTFVDTYAKVGFAKLYDVRTAITAAELLNDRVIPFYEEHGIPLCRILTDRGSEYCGNPERHEYELYLAIENIDHSRTKTKSPQTNGICERFHKTVLDEFYRVAFRKKLYRSIAELQADLDEWLRQYNEVRTHQGRWCYGKTPMQTFLDSLPIAREKLIDQQSQPVAVAC